MLKALTGFTLPDDTRVEANTVVEDDFADAGIIDRLLAKGVLVLHKEPEPPVPEAVEDADAPSALDPSPTTPKGRKVRTAAQSVEEQS